MQEQLPTSKIWPIFLPLRMPLSLSTYIQTVNVPSLHGDQGANPHVKNSFRAKASIQLIYFDLAATAQDLYAIKLVVAVLIEA
ncbi:MAG: hypothetical protein ACJAUP_002259 [Cellvibrionaceae bacterium]|jgi:hypothetical protein